MQNLSFKRLGLARCAWLGSLRLAKKKQKTKKTKEQSARFKDYKRGLYQTVRKTKVVFGTVPDERTAKAPI